MLDFLEAEHDLVSRMEEDKVRFMEDSTKHPGYRYVIKMKVYLKVRITQKTFNTNHVYANS